MTKVPDLTDMRFFIFFKRPDTILRSRTQQKVMTLKKIKKSPLGHIWDVVTYCLRKRINNTHRALEKHTQGAAGANLILIIVYKHSREKAMSYAI